MSGRFFCLSIKSALRLEPSVSVKVRFFYAKIRLFKEPFILISRIQPYYYKRNCWHTTALSNKII